MFKLQIYFLSLVFVVTQFLPQIVAQQNSIDGNVIFGEVLTQGNSVQKFPSFQEFLKESGQAQAPENVKSTEETIQDKFIRSGNLGDLSGGALLSSFLDSQEDLEFPGYLFQQQMDTSQSNIPIDFNNIFNDFDTSNFGMQLGQFSN
eukprot:TRINITY_DN982_c0_g2_i1.p5 TRINITY_DN982_c0_g2~~TRINITY_DN982_c0_g2_i1.p5  ORF type:complete len:147 (-),score=13.82 TRINITY_DN982_c0_g2_i1:1770-2210(-)